MKNHLENKKSVNLQYITLGCLDNGTNESSIKSLIFQLLFFYTFYRLQALKTLYFYLCNFIKKNKKIIWKDFCKEFCKKSWKKNNTWNIRHLVDESFVPANQQTRVLYCRLSDFRRLLRWRSLLLCVSPEAVKIGGTKLAFIARIVMLRILGLQGKKFLSVVIKS